MLQLPDTAISSPEQDLFSLAPFAQRLARVVRAGQVRENMVIGLNGARGSGKTSVVNMAIAWLMAMERAGLDRFAADDGDEHAALEALLEGIHADERADYLAHIEQGWGGSASGGQTVVVRYDAWLMSGHDTLISDFFRVLGERVEGALDERGRAVREAAGRLADIIDLTQTASSGMGRLLSLYAETGGNARPGFLQGILRQGRPSPIPSSLREARDLLIDALLQFTAVNCRVLVVIDNIDRLKAEEIRPLLSMVKAVGNLPNISYLLAYDRHVLDDALEDRRAEDREMPRFLEKIVQLDLDMPRVTGERLLEALIARADDIFGLPLDDSEREDLTQSFRHRQVLLQTPRDVTRLRNALSFADAATGRCIRTTDLIRIEMIRLKEKAVFDWIVGNAIYFHPRIGIPKAEGPGSELVFVESGLDHARKGTRQAVNDVLAHTFVNIARATGLSAFPPQDRLHPLDTRYPLHSWEGWECYLQSFPDADVIGRDEWAFVNGICADVTKSRSYVQTLVSRRRSDGKPLLLSFLDGLARLAPASGSEPVGLLAALLELPDAVVAESFGLTHRSALRAVHVLLARCEEPDDVLLGLILKGGVNPFAIVVLLELFAEQLGLMAKGKGRERCAIGEGDLVQSIATVYLRISSLPPERVGDWFSTVDLHRLLALGIDRKALLAFSQKLLSKPSPALRYFLQDVCTNWPSETGIIYVLARRPDADLYPLEEMRNYALRMSRADPDDRFFQDFVEAADDFLSMPALKDRTAQLRTSTSSTPDP